MFREITRILDASKTFKISPLNEGNILHTIYLYLYYIPILYTLDIYYRRNKNR